MVKLVYCIHRRTGLSREEFTAIAEAAHEAGIPIASHVSFETGLDTALALGQDSIDHLDAYAEALVPPDHPLRPCRSPVVLFSSFPAWTRQRPLRQTLPAPDLRHLF